MVMSDRIALLRQGELEQVASPREIYDQPATAYTAQFIGHTNLLRGEVKDGVVRCHSLDWPVALPDGPALFSLRPENIRVSDNRRGRKRLRTWCAFAASICQQAFHGATELLASRMCRWAQTLACEPRQRRHCRRSGAGILGCRCRPGSRIASSRRKPETSDVFPRLPGRRSPCRRCCGSPSFLSVPMRCFSATASGRFLPSQMIVHSWTLDNYRELLRVNVYLANSVSLHVDCSAGNGVFAAAGLSAGLLSCRFMRAARRNFLSVGDHSAVGELSGARLRVEDDSRQRRRPQHAACSTCT